MHSFAFGEIGLLPCEYYALLPVEFNSLAEGYHKRQSRLSGEKRYATYISILPFVKDLSYQKFCSEYWPLAGDIKEEKKESMILPTIDADTWQALKKQMAPRKSEYEKILDKHHLKI